MPAAASAGNRASLLAWIKDLTAPPDPAPHNLMPIRGGESQDGGPEKVYFLSEIGHFVPGLPWKPDNNARPRRKILVVNEAGKEAFAESGLAEPLRNAGNAVSAIDTRGRGETLGVMGNRDNNYHLISIAIMAGPPLAGRRAFDLMRAVDFVARRDDLPLDDPAVIGRGGDALPALLAAAGDARIRRVAVAGRLHSFVSQIVAAKVSSPEELLREWNQMAMRHGRLRAERYTVDLGAVMSSSLEHGDIAGVVSLLDGINVLFCEAKDRDMPEMAATRERFARATGAHYRCGNTAVGRVAVSRPYYLCPHFRRSQFPADVELDIDNTGNSPGVRRMLATVGQDVPFEHGRQQRKLLADLEVTAKAVERTAEGIGEDIAAREERQLQRAMQLVSPGLIEAGCKTVIGARLKQSGMFWTVHGANAILALRCCQMNGEFEDYRASRAA